MTASAAVLGIAGIVLIFLPQEFANLFNLAGTEIILQVLGALYFGFAMLNWAARANLIGGIYSRPVAIGNLTHFAIGGLALVKLAFHHHSPSYIWIAIVYSVFAILFGYVFYTSPAMKNKSA
jgi:drug/metabolite transporter (DMT)-like permease